MVAGGVGFLGAAARVLSPAAGSLEASGATGVVPSGADLAAGAPVFDGVGAVGFTVPEADAEFRAPVPAGDVTAAAAPVPEAGGDVGAAGAGVCGLGAFGRGGGAG